MNNLLEGKVAFVTGAGGGIGRAIAKAFVTQGAKVVVAEYNTASGNEAVAEVESMGGEALFIETDINRLETVEAAVARTIEHWGQLDILVNNAYPTMSNAPARIENIDTERLQGGLTAGFLAISTAMQAAFPSMKAQQYGRIINICSLNGVNAHKYTAEYNCAKEAVRAYTRTAAVEWAREGITANIICPGAATTPFKAMAEMAPQMADDVNEGNPMGYLGDPDRDIAPVAVFLASDMSIYMTGNTLFVDGGGHINGVPWSPFVPD